MGMRTSFAPSYLIDLLSIHRHVASMVVKIVYGYEVSGNPLDDPLIRMNEHGQALVKATGNFGATPLDILPFRMQWRFQPFVSYELFRSSPCTFVDSWNGCEEEGTRGSKDSRHGILAAL